MSRIAFVSRPAWGHVDLGGRGFARTAGDLARRGHDVHWLLLRTEAWPGRDAFTSEMQALGVTVGSLDGPLNLGRGAPVAALDEVARQLEPFDACAIDRVAVTAGVAAHRAGTPWAAFGTNGRPWTRSLAFGVQPGRFDDPTPAAAHDRLALDGYPADGRRSCWLISPSLNVSFFPAGYYAAGTGPATHCVGAGPIDDDGPRDVVLATAGASLTEGQGRVLDDLLRRAVAAHAKPWRVLGGAAGGAWQPYARAAADACLVIGHGGNAVVWQAMREGVPVISLPTARGDQMYGAAAAARLGFGRWRSLADASVPWLVDTVDELTASGPVGAAARRARADLASGGGVPAAARLVECLARDGAPVTACVDDRCCCVGPDRG